MPRVLLTATSVHICCPTGLAILWVSGAGCLVRDMIRGSYFLACRQHLHNYIHLPWRSALRVFLCCVSHTLHQAATPSRDEYACLWFLPASKMQTGKITYFILLFFSGLRPKRTLCLVLWTGEEQGGVGAFQYYQLHKVKKAAMSCWALAQVLSP